MTTKSEIIDSVVEHVGLTKAQATKAVNAVFEGIVGSLMDGESVSVHGFGKFEAVEKAARPGRNPRTGETVTIPARTSVKFSAAKQLKDALI